jgi:hypothetical protein
MRMLCTKVLPSNTYIIAYIFLLYLACIPSVFRHEWRDLTQTATDGTYGILCYSSWYTAILHPPWYTCDMVTMDNMVIWTRSSTIRCRICYFQANLCRIGRAWDQLVIHTYWIHIVYIYSPVGGKSYSGRPNSVSISSSEWYFIIYYVNRLRNMNGIHVSNRVYRIGNIFEFNLVCGCISL